MMTSDRTIRDRANRLRFSFSNYETINVIARVNQTMLSHVHTLIAFLNQPRNGSHKLLRINAVFCGVLLYPLVRSIVKVTPDNHP